jgi:hypothetical protein
LSSLRAVLLAAALLAGCGEPGVAWEDAAGDAQPLPKAPQQPRLDIVRVDARGKDGALRLKVRLKDSLERHFAYRRPEGFNLAGVVAHFYLDTDNDPKTGGHPTFGDNALRPMRGYDLQIVLQLGWRVGDGKASGVAAGDALIDATRHAKAEGVATFALAKIRQGRANTEMHEPAAKDEILKAVSWKGDTIEAAIPYAWLGIKPGDTVRLCFYERDASTAPDRGYSEDRVLKLGR